MMFAKAFISVLFLSLSLATAAQADSTLECSLKTMGPSGSTQNLATKDVAVPKGGSGLDLALSQGNFSATAYMDNGSGNDSFVIDLHDNSSGRQAGVQTNGAAVRASKITSTLRITEAGDWVFIECSLK